MHEVPRIFLLLESWLRRKVSRDTVEERPGPAAQLHPIRRTLMMGVVTRNLLTTDSLVTRGRDILHEGLEVVAGPTGTAIHLLCSHQECLSLLHSTRVSLCQCDEILK